jgi:geranyl-CoA carboxylase alpha subunit
VQDAGLTWVGPPPAAIRALGLKSAAKALALSRDVPVLPGYHGADQSEARLAAEAAHIGAPLMVKAAAGGGGRGMRLVTDLAQFAAAAASARSEAQSAFGSGELLLERALLAPRHVEVQVFCDAHGHGIHLGERDCSVQRRHQKIIEETPSPAVDAALRARMGHCAVQLALAAGYVGAGTVEFLVEAGAFYLMEMNTRLQVEHPVTEAVTGLDLVEWQLRIAQGQPLPLTQEQVCFEGHAIEVRLCAEDDDFTPHAGTVHRWRAPDGVRVDHALFDGLAVPPHYDSMLGKLVAHAPTRAEAIARLAAALDATVLLGLPSNRAFLAACLRHPVFAQGQALIPFLVEHGGEIRASLQERERAAFETCALAAVYADAPVSPLACRYTRPVRLRHRDAVHALAVTAPPALPAGVQAVRVDGARWHLQYQGADLWVEDASFEHAAGAGGAAAVHELRAPFNGKVIAVAAAAGRTVHRGDTLLVLESMKLEHALAAPRDAVVQSVHVEPGQQAATSQVLVRFEAVRA